MKKSKIIGGILTFLSIILCLYVSIEVIVANKDNRPPSFFSFSISYVPTDSMVDEIMPGDYILFNSVSYEEVSVGDIIVYRSKEGVMKNKFIVHRVIEQKDDYFICQGDNNPTPDNEHITTDMIIGRYICVIPFMSALSGNSRNILIGFLLIASLVLIILQTVSIFMKYIKEKEALKKNEELEELKEKMKAEILAEELEKLKIEKEAE